MTLAALLEELKEVDVKAYTELKHVLGKLDRAQEDDMYEIDVSETVDVEPRATDMLQGCIQRACERRDWHWLVCKDCYREGEYRAEISIVAESCISDILEVDEIAMEWGDTAAEALLAAYIAAVKKEKR